MIQGVQSQNGFMQNISIKPSLSSEQKELVGEILSQFDSSDISKSDAQAISSAFKENGIRPSSDLRQTINDNGFDADLIRSLSSDNGGNEMQVQKAPPPPPPPPQKEQNANADEQKSVIEEILEDILNPEEDLMKIDMYA